MDSQTESSQKVDSVLCSEPKPAECDMEARVQAMWEQMNKGLGKKPVKPVLSKSISSTMNANSKKFNDNWMKYLGLAPKKAGCSGQDNRQNGASGLQDDTGKEDEVAARSDQMNKGVSNNMFSSQSSDSTSQNKSDVSTVCFS